METRILLIEDMLMNATTAAEVIRRERAFDLVGVARSCAEARSLCLTLRPAVIVADWLLGDGNALDLVRELHAPLDRARWLIISAHSCADLVLQADELPGVWGVIDKADNAWSRLREAIELVAKGREYFCPASAEILRAARQHPEHYLITARQREILRRLDRHESRAGIARALGCSRAAVSQQIAAIARKLDLIGRPSPATVIPAARAHGLLPRLPAGF